MPLDELDNWLYRQRQRQPPPLSDGPARAGESVLCMNRSDSRCPVPDAGAAVPTRCGRQSSRGAEYCDDAIVVVDSTKLALPLRPACRLVADDRLEPRQPHSTLGVGRDGPETGAGRLVIGRRSSVMKPSRVRLCSIDDETMTTSVRGSKSLEPGRSASAQIHPHNAVLPWPLADRQRGDPDARREGSTDPIPLKSSQIHADLTPSLVGG